MGWKPISLHFKQVYTGAYRYLDRCGEFMLAAEDKLRLMPEEAKPSGCKMVHPENGIVVTLDTIELSVAQEFHSDGGSMFVEICQSLAGMVEEFFTPRNVESNGFASKTHWAQSSSDQAMAASLKLPKGIAVDLAREVEMPARQENINCRFASGSMELRVEVKPMTFQSFSYQRFTPPHRSTPTQLQRMERLNRKADRMDTTLGHGLMMELDLIEYEPPPAPLSHHFEQLLKKESSLQKRFILS